MSSTQPRGTGADADESTVDAEPETADPDPGPESEVLTEDEVFDVLSNDRRRFAVHALERDEPADIGDLAEQIAAWECDVSVEEVNYDQRKRVYTSLQQSHLPKLDDAGVVEFDKSRGVVEPTPALDEVDVYMDVVRGNEIPWSEYYLGLSAVSVALLGAVWANAWPFVLLPDLAWATAVIAGFSVSALVHQYYADKLKIGSGEKPPELRD